MKLFVVCFAELWLLSVLYLKAGEAQGTFCSFFGNKSPSPQPGLQNCTWYRESSCCVNEEVESLFSKVLVPDNSNGVCRNYINYLMCYVCDPRQSNFYQQERLTVCADFCDDVLDACSNAVLKGRRMGSQYGSNGTAFCEDQRFQVSTRAESCFTLATSKRTLRGSSSAPRPSVLLVLLMVLGVVGSGGRFASKLAALLPVAIVLLLISPSHGLINEANIRTLATQVGNHLQNAGSGIGRDALQDLYNGATSSTRDMLNQTAILEAIGDKLMSITDDLDTAATAVRAAVLNARRSAPSKPFVSPGLDSLASSVYRDADSRQDMASLNPMYNSTFRRYISFQQSTVKIPDNVDRDSVDVYDTIRWSANIDNTLKSLSNKRNVRWAYFGSETGVYRSYPATEWDSNFAGFRVDFDPRSRPWYLAATSGPKAVGIVLDCSISMAESNRFAIAKAAVKQIINSLSRDDQVNVVCSRGSYIDAGASSRTFHNTVLGCNTAGLMRATPSNRAQLLEALDAQSTRGSGENLDEAVKKVASFFKSGSPTPAIGCQQIMVFISDGKDTDEDAFRSICYHKDRGSYGCNLIRTDFSKIYTAATDAANTKGIKMVGIETGNQGSTLPGKIGCDNGGLYVQLLSPSNVRTQLNSYFSYLARLSNTENEKISPTAPYVDTNGLGRIITLSRVIYDPDNANNLLGVIGVDAVLDDLENTLLDDQFGLSYAFLIDNEGRAIIHPRLKPSAELVDDPVYPNIADLELYRGQPAQFTATNGILAAMMNQETGATNVLGPRPQQAGGLQDAVIWIDNVNFTYSYSAVTGTQYSFAFVLTLRDEFQVRLDNYPYNASHPNYYHEISKYNSATRSSIGFTSSDQKYNNLAVARQVSTFKLAAQSFCDPTRYLLSDVPNFTTVNSFFSGNSAQLACDSGGVFVPDVRSTVYLTNNIENTWKGRSTAVDDEVVWTYFGSANGMWRSYPGSRSTRDYDPTRRPWYHRALANPPTLLATSSVYLDAGGIGKVVTLAQTVFQTVTMSSGGVACTATTDRPGNCACTTNSQCRSLYCYKSKCSNPQVAGVAAVDILYGQFAEMVQSSLVAPGIPTGDRCTQANVDCLVINDAAEVVYSAGFSNVSDGDPRNYASVPLGQLNGAVMLDLTDKGVFSRISFRNLQGTCQAAPYAPRAADRDLILSAEQRDNYYENRGPIPRFSNDFGCQLDQIQYQRNSSVSISSTISQSFSGACSDGSYRLVAVADTNLMLLVVETTTAKSGRLFNFNCHIWNNVARSGGFASKETACGNDHEESVIRGVCPTATTHTPACSYSGAPPLVSPSTLLAVLMALIPVFLQF